MRSLASQIKGISSPTFRAENEAQISEALMLNGYPKPFLDAHFLEKPARTLNEPEVQRFIVRIGFRGDAAAELLRRKLTKSVHDNCYNAKLLIVFTSGRLISTRAKEPIPELSTSSVIYQYTCSTCGMQYVGHSRRRLEDRVKEHLPRWALNALAGSSHSSITDHMVNEGHLGNRDSDFKILFRPHRNRLLKFLEAVTIRELKPSLNVQVELDYQLKLPWS